MTFAELQWAWMRQQQQIDGLNQQVANLIGKVGELTAICTAMRERLEMQAPKRRKV